MDRGRFDEAQQVYEAALAASRKAHPEPHVDVGYLLASLGRLALERKQYAEAERRYREAIAIYEKTLPAGHGYTAAALTMLGRAQLELGRPQQAEATLKRALEEWSKDYGAASPYYAQARAVLGRAWAMQRRFAEAEPALLETYPRAGASASRRSADGDRARLDRGPVPGNRPAAAGASLLPAGAGRGPHRAHSIVLSSGSRARPQSRRIRSLARRPANKS